VFWSLRGSRKADGHRDRIFGPVISKFPDILQRFKNFFYSGSLRKLLDNKSVKISFHQVIKIAKDIAKGMRHLHHEKIVHRDLSARNVLVTDTKDGWLCKVADFDILLFYSFRTVILIFFSLTIGTIE
jgi:hypothetical protein